MGAQLTAEVIAFLLICHVTHDAFLELNSDGMLYHGLMVSPAEIEPATYALGGRRAIQLCHGDIVYKSII